MYLHLGQNTVVRQSEIVGIFDMDTATISKNTRQFLADAQKGGRVFNVSMELPKSFVVCTDAEGNRDGIYFADFVVDASQAHGVHGYAHLFGMSGWQRKDA